VRNLANKSADAAKDTEYLIEETQKSVVSGNTILTKTASSLNDVITSSYSISDTINEVSEYSLKQSKTIEQILISIDKISSIIQQNSSAAEEDAQTSEELSSQAQELHMI